MHVIDVLRGKGGERVTRWDHDKLNVFGAGSELNEQGWRNVFRQLIALGFAQVDHSAHGAIKLTESSRPVLKGERQVEMRPVVESGRKKKAVARTSDAVDLSTADADLLERLKEWRRNEASTQGVPAYVILHNSSLTEIARTRPTDVDALAAIGGIGAMKLERYGAAVIGLVAEDRADNAARSDVESTQDNA